MFRTAARLLLPLLLAGCLGTDVDNPDQKRGEDSSILVAEPRSLALGPVCAGGTARRRVRIRNRSAMAVEAAAGGPDAEAYPSIFALDGGGERTLAVVIRIPGEAREEAAGELFVHHVVPGDDRERELVIPWRATIEGAQAPQAAILCGEEAPCEALRFGRIFVGPTWQIPLEVANDGCEPLTIAAVEAEGGGAWIAGPDRPAELAPGARWSGALLVRPDAAGTLAGEVIVRIDGATARRIPFSAEVEGP